MTPTQNMLLTAGGDCAIRVVFVGLLARKNEVKFSGLSVMGHIPKISRPRKHDRETAFPLTNRVPTGDRVRRAVGEGTVQGHPNLLKDGCKRPYWLNAGCSGNPRKKIRAGIGKPSPVASKSEAKRPAETVAPMLIPPEFE